MTFVLIRWNYFNVVIDSTIFRCSVMLPGFCLFVVSVENHTKSVLHHALKEITVILFLKKIYSAAISSILSSLNIILIL